MEDVLKWSVLSQRGYVVAPPPAADVLELGLLTNGRDGRNEAAHRLAAEQPGIAVKFHDGWKAGRIMSAVDAANDKSKMQCDKLQPEVAVQSNFLVALWSGNEPAALWSGVEVRLYANRYTSTVNRYTSAGAWMLLEQRQEPVSGRVEESSSFNATIATGAEPTPVPDARQSDLTTHPATIDIARSNFGKCKTCRRTIPKGTPRISVTDTRIIYTPRYHPCCWPQPHAAPHTLQGWDTLPADARRQLQSPTGTFGELADAFGQIGDEAMEHQGTSAGCANTQGAQEVVAEDVVMEETHAPGQGGSVQGSATDGVPSPQASPQTQPMQGAETFGQNGAVVTEEVRLVERLTAWLRPASTVPSEFPASNTELECSVSYCYTLINAHGKRALTTMALRMGSYLTSPLLDVLESLLTDLAGFDEGLKVGAYMLRLRNDAPGDFLTCFSIFGSRLSILNATDNLASMLLRQVQVSRDDVAEIYAQKSVVFELSFEAVVNMGGVSVLKDLNPSCGRGVALPTAHAHSTDCGSSKDPPSHASTPSDCGSSNMSTTFVDLMSHPDVQDILVKMSCRVSAPVQLAHFTTFGSTVAVKMSFALAATCKAALLTVITHFSPALEGTIPSLQPEYDITATDVALVQQALAQFDADPNFVWNQADVDQVSPPKPSCSSFPFSTGCLSLCTEIWADSTCCINPPVVYGHGMGPAGRHGPASDEPSDVPPTGHASPEQRLRAGSSSTKSQGAIQVEGLAQPQKGIETRD